MGEVLAPFQEHVTNLTTIPGVNDSDRTGHGRRDRARHEPLPEPRPPNLLGRILPTTRRERRQASISRIRKGAPWLKTALVSAAWGAIRTKGSYLRAQFARLKSRRGAKKAIIAVAASMLTAAYHILSDAVHYKDLGAEHFNRHDRSKAIQRLLRRLNDMGCSVQLMPQEA